MEITTEKDSDDMSTQPEIMILQNSIITNNLKLTPSTSTKPETTSKRIESTTNNPKVVSNQAERDGKATTLSTNYTSTASPLDATTRLETTTESKRRSNHPFIRYFRRLRKIYELDLKILDQIAALLEGINDELLPQVADALEPLLISQTVNMLDLGQILGYVAQTIHSSTFQLGASTSLGGLDFLKFGKLILTK